MTLLQISELRAGYGSTTVVDGVSLDVERGETVTVLGHNAAGKSTLMRAVVGLARVTGGLITLDGQDLRSLNSSRRAQLGVGYVPADRALYHGMTVREHLIMGGITSRRSVAKRRIAEVVERFPTVLGRFSETQVDRLSGGQQQIVAIGRALVGEPKLLMLDEPTIGLAPAVMKEVLEIVDGLRRDGLGILLVEQNVAIALRYAGRALVMERGRVALEDRADRLMGDGRIAAQLLARSPGLAPSELRGAGVAQQARTP